MRDNFRFRIILLMLLLTVICIITSHRETSLTDINPFIEGLYSLDPASEQFLTPSVRHSQVNSIFKLMKEFIVYLNPIPWIKLALDFDINLKISFFLTATVICLFFIFFHLSNSSPENDPSQFNS